MELRKDYILDRWVIINPKRGQRPNQFVAEKNVDVGQCFFCPGNESMTPAEIGRLGKDKWQMRWFPNKFPAVNLEGNYNIKTDNTFFTFGDAIGYHEIIAETPDHQKQIFDLDAGQLVQLFKVYQQRINELKKKEGIKYVSVFKNHGPDAGTSIVHSHTQIIAHNLVPASIMERLEAVKKFSHCPYCDIINIEKNSFRRCFENDSFVAFTPYASRFNYEIHLYPKQHITDFCSLNEEQSRKLAEIFLLIMQKIKVFGSFNYFLNNYDGLHFNIEFCPRIAKWAGFEFATGTIINTVSPEEAAKFCRGEE